MARMTRLTFLRHLRSGPNQHVLHYRRGKLRRNGRGLAFWFLPLSSSIAEIPCDDRDQPFLFHGRSRDFQDVAVQGSITYRVVDPLVLAQRLDFTVDLDNGLYLKSPLEQLSELLTQLAQQLAWDSMNRRALRELLQSGVDEIRQRIREGLTSDKNLQASGLEIVSVRVAAVTPTTELEKALQAPTRESIQQQSDEAVFQRRAMAVEKERAIAENELNNRIELARRQEQLIAQQGHNRQQEARERSEAARIRSEAEAQRHRLEAEVEAQAIREVERAKAESIAQRMEIYRDLPSHVMLSLAARTLAGNLQRIEHLSLGGESFAPLLTTLMQQGIRHLQEHPSSEVVAAAPAPRATEMDGD